MTAIHVFEFIFIMIVLVILHEMGHMFVAKWCGMRVERFSVFFGRPLWSVKRGETEYGVGWLPLGGYVKITGMSREELFDREYDSEGRLIRETPVAPEIAARAYCNSTTPRKVATILAGPMANVVVALVAFALSFWIGNPVYQSTATLDTVEPGLAAAVSGLRPGDVILGINDVAPTTNPNNGLLDSKSLREEIQRNLGKSVTLRYKRGDTELTATTPPLSALPTNPKQGRLGISFDIVQTGVKREGPIGGVVESVKLTGSLTKEQVLALGKLVAGNKTIRDQVQGPIGMGATYNDFAEEGWATILRFAGIISLILAIMNLIPLLPLDGGHIVFALAERVRRRHLSLAAYQRASIVGIAIVLVLAIFAFNNDIVRLTDGTGPKP